MILIYIFNKAGLKGVVKKLTYYSMNKLKLNKLLKYERKKTNAKCAKLLNIGIIK